jgi:hypothetical protein
MLEKASPSLMDAVIVYSIRRFVTSTAADDIERYIPNKIQILSA